MNYKQRLSILLVIVALSLISVGSFMQFVSDYRSDIKLKNSIIENMTSEYTEFTNKTNNIKTKIDDYNNNDKMYINTMLEDSEASVVQLRIVDDDMEDIVSIATNLEQDCKNNYGIDENIDKRCNMFESNYNSLKESYIDTIERHNNQIESYNEWAVNNSKEELTVFTSKNYEEIK